MRWLVVLLVLPLASAELVHEDPIDDQEAPHPALLKEFDIAEVRVNATRAGPYDGVRVSVGYECANTVFATNRTTRFTYTLGNETVQQGPWEMTLDSCRVGEATGIFTDASDCIVTGIFVEAVWRRPDGTHVLDRAPDTGGLTFDACPIAPTAHEDQTTSTTPGEGSGRTDRSSVDPEWEAPATEHQVPTGAWPCLVALALAAGRRF